MRIRGAYWRQEQEYRTSMREAWYTAMLTRISAADFPDLKELLPDADPIAVVVDPELIQKQLTDWAAERGFPVEHHEAPVI